jgi:rhodanese-related sulfurtransferase
MNETQPRRTRKHLRASYRQAVDAAEYFKSKLAHETTPYELKARMDKDEVLILDVRDHESFKMEHIPGARNIPLQALAEHLGTLPRDRVIVAYCWNMSCHLAARACVELAQKGFCVMELVGGIEEWKRRELLVESS